MIAKKHGECKKEICLDRATCGIIFHIMYKVSKIMKPESVDKFPEGSECERKKHDITDFC